MNQAYDTLRIEGYSGAADCLQNGRKRILHPAHAPVRRPMARPKKTGAERTGKFELSFVEVDNIGDGVIEIFCRKLPAVILRPAFH